MSYCLVCLFLLHRRSINVKCEKIVFTQVLLCLQGPIPSDDSTTVVAGTTFIDHLEATPVPSSSTTAREEGLKTEESRDDTGERKLDGATSQSPDSDAVNEEQAEDVGEPKSISGSNGSIGNIEKELGNEEVDDGELAWLEEEGMGSGGEDDGQDGVDDHQNEGDRLEDEDGDGPQADGSEQDDEDDFPDDEIDNVRRGGANDRPDDEIDPEDDDDDEDNQQGDEDGRQSDFDMQDEDDEVIDPERPREDNNSVRNKEDSGHADISNKPDTVGDIKDDDVNRVNENNNESLENRGININHNVEVQDDSKRKETRSVAPGSDSNGEADDLNDRLTDSVGGGSGNSSPEKKQLPEGQPLEKTGEDTGRGTSMEGRDKNNGNQEHESRFREADNVRNDGFDKSGGVGSTGPDGIHDGLVENESSEGQVGDGVESKASTDKEVDNQEANTSTGTQSNEAREGKYVDQALIQQLGF